MAAQASVRTPEVTPREARSLWKRLRSPPSRRRERRVPDDTVGRARDASPFGRRRLGELVGLGGGERRRERRRRRRRRARAGRRGGELVLARGRARGTPARGTPRRRRRTRVPPSGPAGSRRSFAPSFSSFPRVRRRTRPTPSRRDGARETRHPRTRRPRPFSYSRRLLRVRILQRKPPRRRLFFFCVFLVHASRREQSRSGSRAPSRGASRAFARAPRRNRRVNRASTNREWAFFFRRTERSRGASRRRRRTSRGAGR